MLLYVKEIKREANLYAYGVDGEEKTYELIRLICPEPDDENKGYGIAFYKLTEEERLALQTEAEYAITVDLYRLIYEFIEKGWGVGMEHIGGVMRERNFTVDRLHSEMETKYDTSVVL